ncbi:Gem (Nuclear organelle) associated protein 6 [Bulinus truncatus]|nr:Gem (Nuclear organelle) associated protein 6 [Bulinus truncatus]
MMKSVDKNVTEMNNVHPIFTKDPKEWLKYVNSHVEAMTEDGQKHSGYVFTIDPVSESIVLLTQLSADNPTNISVKLLMGSSVRSIEMKAQDSGFNQSFFDSLFRPAMENNFSESELHSKLLNLKSWLEQNRIPVSVTGDKLTVADALTIHPPYTLDCCLSTNEIILARIQGLMRNMP